MHIAAMRSILSWRTQRNTMTSGTSTLAATSATRRPLRTCSMTIARNCDAYQRGMKASLEVHAITLTKWVQDLGSRSAGTGIGIRSLPLACAVSCNTWPGSLGRRQRQASLNSTRMARSPRRPGGAIGIGARGPVYEVARW